MAEIGLIGSIFSVAAVGASVATTLYDTADVMIHANQQIIDLAKHVSQFTAVLKHMGQVLESEKANCSKDVLRDIRKIKHSSKRTFKEINSALKSKHFRHFVPVRWLFKRTKAIELQKRLDSQQSMLQCMIHTLTVSKLSHMDSRSKKDSEHITGLKAEIGLLKTFIMESYNNLTELRHAEQSTEAESRFESLSGGPNHPSASRPYRDNGNASSIPRGRSNVPEPPATWSSSPRPSASNSEDESSDSEDGVDDDDDVNSIASADQSDKSAAGRMYTPKAEGLLTKMSHQPFPSDKNNTSDVGAHRESNILLQMVPYRPRARSPIRSDHLICGWQSSDGNRTSAKEEATNSVRLLLDKWTNSGSAPISSVLDEEAAREKHEAADKRRALDSQSDAYRRLSSLGAELDEDDFGPQRYPGYYPHPPPFQDDDVPPPRIRDHLQPQYGHPPYTASIRRHKDFWKPSQIFPQLPDGQLGVEILAALRSTTGGIYYTKSNQFKQVHLVDQRPIYTCEFVPSHMILYSEWKPLNTELDRGLVRREALDLLGYSYTETETGKFSISGDLELRDIEELVKLSYQALDRKSKELSKAVIKERGLAEAIDAINRDMPYTYTHGPPPTPHIYTYEPPPMAQYRNQTESPNSGYPEYHQNIEHENDFPTKTTLSQVPQRRPREYEIERPQSHSIPVPRRILRQEREVSKLVRPEVRFTLPRAQTASSAADTNDKSHPSEPKPNVPETSKTDEELLKLRIKLEELKKKREVSQISGNHTVAADLTYYVIPDLEKRIEVLKEEQRQEQEKRRVTLPRNDVDRKSHHTEVDTESE